MGEALIVRRGGGFKAADLSNLYPSTDLTCFGNQRIEQDYTNYATLPANTATSFTYTTPAGSGEMYWGVATIMFYPNGVAVPIPVLCVKDQTIEVSVNVQLVGVTKISTYLYQNNTQSTVRVTVTPPVSTPVYKGYVQFMGTCGK